ncbi:hypothetical protein CNBC3260 [Cryptococcus deneoformans B-3501A]|uniref:hypothetical protein n=1 Tax=Cryptococcus deneoformans (strain B-3501A) TaxID=283643 RepID=UPI000042C1AD|nr:hypothetical protein CNBC3260 [Cryptococcus neoformans var. neoformans B-3501A]EAL22188.1 hypothetical protein CNBC3260 [Cryptococcus neoformans var. neoformans B-3501A]
MPGANVVSESENKKWALLNWRPKKVEEEDGGMSGNEEMGMTVFLLKFGEGMEEVPVSRLYISALTIGLSYFIGSVGGGLIPLIPYMEINIKIIIRPAAGLTAGKRTTTYVLAMLHSKRPYTTSPYA